MLSKNQAHQSCLILKHSEFCEIFSDTYFVENQQNSPIYKGVASTIKIPLSLRMQRNLK